MAKEMLAKQQDVARKKQQLAFEEAQNMQKKQELAFEEGNVKVETELAKALARERVFSAETERERDETKRGRGEADAMNEYLDAHLSKANVNDQTRNGFTQAAKATDTDRPREHGGQSTEQLRNERSGLPDAPPSQHSQVKRPGRPAAPTHVMESEKRKNVQDDRQQRVAATKSNTLNYDAPAFTPQTQSQNARQHDGVKLHATTDVTQPRRHSDHASQSPSYGASRSPADNGTFAMNNLLTTLSLPRPEVPKFCGEITEHRSFMSAFEARIASVAVSNADRLYYLQQHLDGEPKGLIQGCLYMNADDGYPNARELLVNTVILTRCQWCT